MLEFSAKIIWYKKIKTIISKMMILSFLNLGFQFSLYCYEYLFWCKASSIRVWMITLNQVNSVCSNLEIQYEIFFIIFGCNIQELEVVFVRRSQKVQQLDKQVEELIQLVDWFWIWILDHKPYFKVFHNHRIKSLFLVRLELGMFEHCPYFFDMWLNWILIKIKYFLISWWWLTAWCFISIHCYHCL